MVPSAQPRTNIVCPESAAADVARVIWYGQRLLAATNGPAVEEESPLLVPGGRAANAKTVEGSGSEIRAKRMVSNDG